MLRQVIASTFVLVLLSTTAIAEKRVALVIGNSAYAKVPKLDNASNDAESMEQMFKTAGFETVIRQDNLGLAAMRRVLRDFSDSAHDAQIAVIFYAGHGIEVSGTNYLVPTDAVLERDVDVQDEAVSLDRVSQALERTKHFRLIILDACRDNPFVRSMRRTLVTRTVRSGYAEIDEKSLPPNTLVAYAQRAGATAQDGQGTKNSPYTTALVKHLPTPGLDIELALRRVRDDVLKSTKNRQEPFKYGSLGGEEIALVSLKSTHADVRPRANDTPLGAAVPSVPLNAAAEADRVCREIDKMTSNATLTAMAQQYKGTRAADCILARIAELRSKRPEEAKSAAQVVPSRPKAASESDSYTPSSSSRPASPQASPAGRPSGGTPPPPP